MRLCALLAAVFLVAACTRSSRRPQKPRFARTPASAAGGLHLVYEVDFARAWEAGRGREALLAGTVDVLRARVAGLTEGGVVRPMDPGSGVEVFLPHGPAAMGEAWRRIARLPGRFRIQLVDDESPFVLALSRRVHDASPEGIEVSVDAWTGPDGGREHHDPYLAAGERQRLVDVLAADATHNPLPPDREFLLEHAGPRWRSYYVIRGGGLDNADVDQAAPGVGWGGRPELQLVLTEAGRRKLADLTTRSVGRKMAMVIDETIETAPIIMTPIANARVHVWTGVDSSVDPAVVKQDVEDLAAALRSGPLPAPLTFMIEERVARLP